MEKQEVISNLHYLPIIMFVSLPSIFIITYIIAVINGHVEPGFPYISDAAALPPESCIFAQFLNIIAVLMCAIVYIRYAQVNEILLFFRLTVFWKKLNNIALIIGIISTFGMSITGNFQETTNLIVHLIGAVLCFGGATLYIWIQTTFSYRFNPVNCSQKLSNVRLVLSIFCTTCFIVVFIAAALAVKDYNGDDPKTWTKNDGGWGMHLLSTITEWLCAITICIYILSFTTEFREVQLNYPKVSYKVDYARRTYGVFNAVTPSTLSAYDSTVNSPARSI